MTEDNAKRPISASEDNQDGKPIVDEYEAAWPGSYVGDNVIISLLENLKGRVSLAIVVSSIYIIGLMISNFHTLKFGFVDMEILEPTHLWQADFSYSLIVLYFCFCLV